MNLSEVENKINEILSNDSEHRQIVMWYDGEQEFEEDIDNLNIYNAEVWKLTNSNWLYTKYHIEIEEPNTNFLIYAPFERPEDKDNYLADMVHYSTQFNADKITLICQDLNIPKEFRNVIEKFSKFWNSNKRTNDFKALNIQNYTKEKIIMGILCVLSKTKTLNFDYVLQNVIINSSDKENKIITEFKKFNILNDFWALIEEKYSYNDKKPTVNKLIINLILNYSSTLFKEGKTPKKWDEYLVSNKNNAKVFIDQFMNNYKYRDCYDKIANIIQKEIHLEGTLSNMLIENYIHCDSFEIFDENITNYYINLLYENQDKIMELDEIIDYRSKTHFYKKYKDKYNFIKWANIFLDSINKFNSIEIPYNIEELIKLFTKDWVLIDKSYRKFYFYYDKYYQDKTTSEDIENLRQLIENMYKNDFLMKVTPRFTKAIGKLDSLNDIHILSNGIFIEII
ncbi:hypothetical protein BGI41_00840 [Methanobrevibacter sp. 87.7]|uniref:hypothetical protein n=1 Tax=Methanobrevibacter sp. 87.7 TaxID=387957 RepID=UPI000B506851|nr:hypothetical protein [Methanobrevibacter sp. 87.7]OWT33740.1 hypothetical protein BGI41_00840 [Methanobrevibacter sp. 87.7]